MDVAIWQRRRQGEEQTKQSLVDNNAQKTQQKRDRTHDDAESTVDDGTPLRFHAQ